jgi:hypothetical protein
MLGLEEYGGVMEETKVGHSYTASTKYYPIIQVQISLIIILST